MGFATIVKKIKRKENELRILLLGLDNAGKTTILKSFMNEELSDIAPTLGFQIQTVTLSGWRLHIWDVGGQMSLRPFWRNYFEETDALIWVCDASDRDRAQMGKALLHSVLKSEKLEGAPLLILLNKFDLAGCLTRIELYDLLELKLIEDSHKCLILSCSALQGKGVKEGFQWILNSQFRL